MDLFKEAAAFMAQHPKTEENDSFLQTPTSREKFVRELKMMYENATNNEIEKALDWALARTDPPYQKEQILKSLRPKLED